jgi:hypothetical protein
VGHIHLPDHHHCSAGPSSASLMEGTWGRRIYGTVKRGDVFTTFYLEMATHSNNVIICRIIVPNEDLVDFPGLYGETLNRMVEKLDRAFNSTKGNHS